MQTLILAQTTISESNSGITALITMGAIAAAILVVIGFIIAIVKRYKKCQPNEMMVIYGRASSGKSSRCLAGGGAFIMPVIQGYGFIKLTPMTIDIPLEGALSLNNIRVNVPSTFTVAVSTDPTLMQNAAERLLGLREEQTMELARDIILGQLRLVIAGLTIEEINKDREKFMALINQNVEQEINKIGLKLLNVNVRDLTDESGYIQAIGKRAAAEAINTARVEVSQAERDGATGEAIAVREKEVSVAAQRATAAEGAKQAEQKRRIAVSAMEAEAVKGESQAQRDLEIAQAQRRAETVAAVKQAEQEQRIRMAQADSLAVIGENEAKQKVVESSARLAELQAEARRRSEVAAAKAMEAILIAERERELARLSKETLAPQEVEKKVVEVAAEAEAEKRRREAKGEADAIRLKYEAEAAGLRSVLEAKAEGYRKLIEACGSDAQVGPTLLLIEQLPKIVEQQVKALQNVKIDKITVWDQGTTGNGRNATTDFLSGMVGALPRLHELAAQAGIELPPALGKVAAQGQAGKPAAQRPDKSDRSKQP